MLHTATLHKPHVSTHTRQAFVDTNISGTLNLLEEAVEQNVGAFVFTSTTSTFGDADDNAEMNEYNFGSRLERLAAGGDAQSELPLELTK